MLKRFVINVYSHGFTIRVCYSNDKPVLLEYCQGLATFDYVWMPKLRRKVRAVTAVYATASRDRMEYGFLKDELPDLIKYLKDRRYTDDDISITEHSLPKGELIECNVEDGVGPRDEEQVDVMRFITEPDKVNRVLNLRTGGGKALKLNAFIKIPGGWSTMGDMKVGTTVTAWDGTPCKVNGVFPQGKRPVYKLTFGDGRTVEADADHLWKVHNGRYRRHDSGFGGTNPWSVMDTMAVKKLVDEGKYRISVPLCLPEDGPEIDLPVDPYMLGLLLGDGCLTGKDISLSKPDRFIFDEAEKVISKFDVKLVERTRNGGCLTMGFSKKSKGTNKFSDALKKLGVMGRGALTKFIPEEYMLGSLEQRLGIIQGLMDTDGYIDTKGTCTFNTSSYELAENMQYLIRSIGGIATMHYRSEPVYTYKGEKLIGHPAYRVGIQHPTPGILFRLPRKKERANNNGRLAKNLNLKIESIEYIGEAETQCISIDHPDHLYVTDGFTVTHNTAMGLMAIAHFGVRAGLVMTSNYIEIWLKSIGWVLGLKKGDFCVIRGSASLKTIVELSQAGENKYKLIFFSISTLRNFLKDHISTGYTINGVTPRQLFETLGIGVRIIDEAHENPHALALQNIHTHVAKTIYLSATLVSDDAFINKQYDKMFPMADRYKLGRNNKHAEVYPTYYTLANPDKAKYTGNKGYSHVTYEQWMMKTPDVFGGYYELIKMLLDETFIKIRKPGQKALVFCSTTEFCEKIAKRLAKEYNPQGLTVSDYVGYHDTNVLYENDIVVSTPTSAGTGKDIPGLLVCISSTAIGSQQKNLQMLGRLRELKDFPEDSPKYIYLVCRSIQKHMEYHLRKLDYFKERSKFIKDYETHFVV